MWDCSTCKQKNDHAREFCANCQQPRPVNASVGEGSSGGSGIIPVVDDDAEPESMEKLISLHLSDLDELRRVEPEITAWLKRNLHKCHSDKKIKKRIQQLLGTFFYVGNFTFLGVWNDLKAHCKAQAMEMGQDMKDYYDDFNLGEVLGKGAPNTWGEFQRDPVSKLYRVVPCPQERASRRQDGCAPMPFPRDLEMSQLWNERCYIHYLRMVAKGVDKQFQDTTRKIVELFSGRIRECPIKGYVRMANKCISKSDHYYESFPRPSLNFDVCRNASTFESPDDLLGFISCMSSHEAFGGHPVRIKNMFLYDEERAKEQFHFRAVMVNWLYTPGFTYRSLARHSCSSWDRYYNYTSAEGFGDMDVSEPWVSWREQIQIARTYLGDHELLDLPVQIVVETQLLLNPYLEGRQKMHLLYQIIRADTDEALYHDFSAEQTPDERSYNTLMDDAVAEVEGLLADSSWDPNTPDSSGDSKLWQASYWGYTRNAELLLEHPNLDINAPRASDQTTPLYMASDKGHEDIVQLLLARPELNINQGSMGTDFTALFAAADNGRERVVAMLLGHPNIDVNKPRSDLGFTPIYMAAQNGNERVIQSLLAHPQIDVNLADLHYGATPLTIAATNGHEGVVHLLLAHPGIEVNRARTDDGNTPLLMAASYGHAKVTELLINHPGIDVNKPNTRDGCTPLFMAAALGFTGVVEALVKVPEVDVNKSRKIDGTTPLYWARAIKNQEIESLLLSHPKILTSQPEVLSELKLT